MDAEATAEDSDATAAADAEVDREETDPHRDLLERVKRALPRYRPAFREEELPRAIRIAAAIGGVPRDRLWVDVDQEARTLKIQGVRYAVPRAHDSAMFGFGSFYPFGHNIGRDAAPEPVAWFENIFEIPESLDMDGIKVAHQGPNLVVVLPKVAPPPRARRVPPYAAHQMRRAAAPQPPRYTTLPLGFTDFPSFGGPFTPSFF
jgi:hypothetical protein